MIGSSPLGLLPLGTVEYPPDVVLSKPVSSVSGYVLSPPSRALLPIDAVARSEQPAQSTKGIGGLFATSASATSQQAGQEADATFDLILTGTVIARHGNAASACCWQIIRGKIISTQTEDAVEFRCGLILNAKGTSLPFEVPLYEDGAMQYDDGYDDDEPFCHDEYDELTTA